MRYPQFIVDDQGKGVIIDSSNGVRMLSEDEPGLWTCAIGTSWEGWQEIARFILAVPKPIDEPIVW